MTLPSSSLRGKGTRVSSNFAKLHRNKDVYGEDVDLWLPERWLSRCPGWLGNLCPLEAALIPALGSSLL